MKTARARGKTRVRRTDRQMLLDKLTKLSNTGANMVSNHTLMDELGWEKSKYDAIKQQLINEELVITGRGRGGTINIANASDDNPLSVFVSYCHADERYKDELLKHLMPLKRMKLIEEWNDRKLKPGDSWDREISKNLKNADIVLLIVTIDFINSDYCYDIELEAALENHEAGLCRVIPIVARNCVWQTAPFAKLQALPKDARPIESWQSKDDAYVEITQKLMDLARDIQKQKSLDD